jgi:glycosyltransferase involved in cell wall biosynthesis
MHDQHNPLISIVTPSYNQAKFIQDTILSVLSQEYPHIEYIVVDGKSTDGTLEIIQEFQPKLTLISETDHGQASAINKGFRLAQGEIFAWLNSDDQYVENTIQTIVEFFNSNPDAAFVYGDTYTMNETGRLIGLSGNIRACDYAFLVTVDDPIVQPGAFWRAELWNTVGPLDESLNFTLDYDFWIRAAEKFTLHYLPKPLAIERIYTQAKTARGGMERLEEIEAMAQKYGGNGLPYEFHPEAIATYIYFRLRQLKPGKIHLPKRGFKKFSPYIHWTPRFWTRLFIFLFALIVFGNGGIPRLRLIKSQLRLKKNLIAKDSSA